MPVEYEDLWIWELQKADRERREELDRQMTDEEAEAEKHAG